MTALIHGSPKAAGGNSDKILQLLEKRLTGPCVRVDTVRTGPETWEALADCEAAVVIFPLYVDSLPSHLLRFFMEWEMDRREQQRRALSLYAVAQCGFYEGEQNRIALEQVSCFCRKAGISWQGGVGLGGAGGFAEMPEALLKPLTGVISSLAEAVNRKEELPSLQFASVGLPRWLYLAAGNQSWIRGASEEASGKNLRLPRFAARLRATGEGLLYSAVMVRPSRLAATSSAESSRRRTAPRYPSFVGMTSPFAK